MTATTLPPAVTRGDLSEWMRHRVGSLAQAERAALRRLAAAGPLQAIDVPLAGASWPRSGAIDADTLDTHATAHAVDPKHYRLFQEHVPRQTWLRILSDPEERRTHAFALALCAALSERAEAHSYLSAPPPATYAAIQTLTDLRWSAPLHSHLPGLACDDGVTLAMAAHASTVACGLRGLARSRLHGPPALDLLYPPNHTLKHAPGRAKLRVLAHEAAHARTERRIFLYADEDGWAAGGFTTEASEGARRTMAARAEREAEHEAGAAEHTLTRAQCAEAGHQLLRARAALAHNASPAELAVHLALRFGLSGGRDVRVQRLAREVSRRDGSQAADLLLAVARLRAIDGDPAETLPLLHAMGHTQLA